MKAEQRLWEEAQDGDGESFALIFDLHRDRVYRHVLRLVDRTADAEDAVAVAFLELWRRRDVVRVVSGSVLPWLLVTATHATRNLTRSSRRYRALLDRLPRPADSRDVAEEYLDASLAGLDPGLASQLRALPWTDQQLITLVALEGYPMAAAAEVLGISLAAVKSRMHRLRQRLQPELQRQNREVTPCPE